MNVTHPGETLRDAFAERGWSLRDAGKSLRFSHTFLRAVMKGLSPISPRLALALGKAKIGSAEFWVRRQANYDLDRNLRKIRATLK